MRPMEVKLYLHHNYSNEKQKLRVVNTKGISIHLIPSNIMLFIF